MCMCIHQKYIVEASVSIALLHDHVNPESLRVCEYAVILKVG